MGTTSNKKVLTVALMGVFIALCYVGTMINIQMPTPVGKTMIHFGNIFCLLAAMFLGGWKGGVCGSIGMGLYDFTSPGYQLYVPETLVLKFFIGLICGLVFSRLSKPKLPRAAQAAIACVCGMLFNVVFNPLASYVTHQYLLGTGYTVADIMAKWTSVTTSINALIAVIAATLLYLALYPALKNTLAKLK